MIFDLSTREKAKKSFELYEKGKIEKTYFYHFTTYPLDRTNELERMGLRPLSELIFDKSTPLGNFLAENEIYISYQNDYIQILAPNYFKDPIKAAYGDDIWNNVVARLDPQNEQDNGLNGFFIPEVNYPTIYHAPEILNTIDMAIDKQLREQGKERIFYKNLLKSKWQQKNYGTFRLKCIIPIDMIAKSRSKILYAAERVIESDYDYRPQLVYVPIENIDAIEIKKIFPISK